MERSICRWCRLPITYESKYGWLHSTETGHWEFCENAKRGYASSEISKRAEPTHKELNINKLLNKIDEL